MTLGPARVERATVGRGDDPAAAVVLSPALVEAQAALKARRAALGIVTRPALDQGQGVEAAASRARPSAAGRANLGHIDMGHAAASTGRPLRLEPVGTLQPCPLLSGNGKVEDLDGAAVEDDHGTALAGGMATVYPRLAAAILQAGQARAARLWLLLLASEPTRRGSYDLDQVYETFAGAGSAWHIGGRRSVQQVLKAGAGIFWTRDDRGRLWRHGPARVGAELDLVGGVGAPVEVPVTDLLGGMHSVKARLFAAALPTPGDPIAQAVLETLTGACPNSQRAYRITAGVEARPQYRFLPGAADLPALQDAHWRHGRGVFVFTDYNGQQGQGRGALLLAKRDPNAYAAALGPARRGRTRKINRRLNLVTNGARGNGPAVDYERFYFQDAAAAGSAYNRARGRRDVAYKQGQGRGVDFWGTLPALEGVGA
jgi:hypothetical protein